MFSRSSSVPRWLAFAFVILLTASMVAPPGAVAQSTATTTAPLNMRSGPGVDNPVITVMPSGATVSVTGSAQSGFLPVSWNGSNGWASADYLTTGGGSDVPATSGSGQTTAALNFRSGPGTGYGIITVIPAGGTVSLTGAESAGFLEAVYNGSQGWVSADYITTGGSAPAPQPDPEPNPGTVTGSAWTTASLNLRSGPGTGYSALTVMPSGTTVDLTGESSNGFLSLIYNGISGWASADYLATGSAPEPPAESPAIGTGTVTANLHLRNDPGTWGASITVIPAGSTVSITGSAQNNYLPVTYNGLSGWSAADWINTSGAPSEPAPAPQPESTMVTTANLNMRSSASLGASVVTVIPSGSTVAVTGGAQNGFLPVVYRSLSGWSSADYLRDPSSTPAPAPEPAPGGGSGLVWPVSGGTWNIIQGYNGGTHQNRSSTAQYYYALDIARVDGGTAGQGVYAPASGTVLWNDPGSGGLAIDMGNGYIIAMFHVTYDSGLGRGDWVSQGQYLGTISGPGGAGYASTPHIDMTLWQSSDGGRTRSAAPFSGGNSISGMSFADVGGWNQHGGTQFTP